MKVAILLAIIAVAAYVIYVSLSNGIGGTSLSQDVVQAIAQAIATAEGFYVSGSRPARDHNPGDMTQDLIGKSVGMDGQFVVYSNDQDGWDNLYAQINLWLSGGSAHANSSSTIADISQFYTTTDQETWASNVAAVLGVTPDTQIGSISS